MKRQLIVSVILFIFTFVFFFWAMFPYSNIAVIAIDKLKESVNISYTSLRCGPLSAQVQGLEINGAPVGNVRASYSPLTLITKSVKLSSDGAVRGNGSFSPSKCVFNAEINPVLVNMLTDKAELSGRVTVSGTASPDNKTASASVYADKVAVETPIGKLDFEKVDAVIDLKGDDINIVKLTSKDSMALNLTGNIKLMKKAPEKSNVNITGTASMLGEEKNISLKGRLDNIKTSVR